ncbi:VOC family protein [bacterium]|nr:VOC family protein [bacterium]
MIGDLHHIELYVSDLGRSREFWGWLLCDVFGYETYQLWDKGISFRPKSEERGCYIVLVQTEDRFQSPSYHRCRTGLNHIAFQVDCTEQIDELTMKLRARGVKILYEDRHPHAGGPDSYAVFFEDPDRIKVEVVSNS